MRLQKKIIFSSAISCALGISLNEIARRYLALDESWYWLVSLLAIGICFWLAYRLTRNLSESLSALNLGLLNFKDNDFSISIPHNANTELGKLARLFNEAASQLRQERQYIYQRELLLDKVIQNSSSLMLLLDNKGRIIYANDAARHFFNQGSKLEGLVIDNLLESMPSELVDAFSTSGDVLFSMGENQETWHFSRGQFELNGQSHALFLLKQMTKELNRQEVATWKKVIRTVSHELNNSVAPIASMVNSGRILTKDSNDEKLDLIFNTIEERTSHLSKFIEGYARFAKLPQPAASKIEWLSFVERLAQYYVFRMEKPLPDNEGFYDLTQLEQVIINLLKNAHESGSSEEEILFSISSESSAKQTGHRFEIKDRGQGMSAQVLRQALLPFYSTKKSGSGIGLPLCREIIEAHGGVLSLKNRKGGGLTTSFWLPISH